MISRLRVVLAWLVMAALPLQGLATATMAFCGAGHEQSTMDAGSVQMRGANHDHSQHSHAGSGQQADKPSSSHPDVQKAGSKALPDVTHKCGVCASCCHTVAIAEFAQWPDFSPLPQAELAEPFVLIHAPPFVLPDKPPRT